MKDINVLLSTLDPILVTNLIKEFQDIHNQYYLGHLQSTQLNGGRFGEIVLRIIESKDTGVFTGIGTQLNREMLVNHAMQNTNLDESFRLHIPHATCLIMDFRNRRNIAHPGTIDVNMMDASLVIHTANWIMAEIVRLVGGTDPQSANEIISKIIERKIPLIEEIEGNLKVLEPSLPIKNKILVCLYQKYPQQLKNSYLMKSLKYTNSTQFKKYLKELDKESRIEYSQKQSTLTILGLGWVEKYIKFDLNI